MPYSDGVSASVRDENGRAQDSPAELTRHVGQLSMDEARAKVCGVFVEDPVKG